MWRVVTLLHFGLVDWSVTSGGCTFGLLVWRVVTLHFWLVWWFVASSNSAFVWIVYVASGIFVLFGGLIRVVTAFIAC